MPNKPQFLTLAQQVARYLREEIATGRWGGELPGRHVLAAELEVSHKTVKAALRELEGEGLVLAHGAGRNRQILPQAAGNKPRGLRVGVFLWADSERSWAPVLHLDHELEKARHRVVYARKSLTALDMDVKRVARVVEKMEVDAWVVVAGSQQVLEWFCRQDLPAFAIYGRYHGLPIPAAGTFGRPSIMIEITRSLIELGHRRISILFRRQHRLPEPSFSVKAFTGTLAEHGIIPSAFNTPDWVETAEGFQDCLVELFRVTPPTALITDEPMIYIAACHFLTHRGIRVPQDISMVLIDASPFFDWCMPSVAQVDTQHEKLIRPVMRWVDEVSRGKPELRQSVITTEYSPGGSVGPAPSAHGPGGRK